MIAISDAQLHRETFSKDESARSRARQHNTIGRRHTMWAKRSCKGVGGAPRLVRVTAKSLIWKDSMRRQEVDRLGFPLMMHGLMNTLIWLNLGCDKVHSGHSAGCKSADDCEHEAVGVCHSKGQKVCRLADMMKVAYVATTSC